MIALILDNSIEYPCVWIGLSKIGCITALINTNLRATPLLHSIRTVNAKGIITSKQIFSGSSQSLSIQRWFTVSLFQIEIQSELNELQLKKVYLFDPKVTNLGKYSNGEHSLGSTTFETISLYERLEQCSKKPTKPIPYDLKRKYRSSSLHLIAILLTHLFSFM